MADTIRGRVIRLYGKDAVVDAGGDNHTVQVRGRFKKEKRRSRSPVGVGDWVLLARQDDDTLHIESVEERRSVLSRRSAHNPRLEQVVAANVDQLLIVIAADSIDYSLELIDRLLVAGRGALLSTAIIANKIDLVSEASAVEALAVYPRINVPLVPLSATSGLHLDRLRALLQGKVSIFAGPSGAGKSSCLNAVQTGLELRTAEVSPDTRAGRHTTTSVSLLPLDIGGYVVDTPGVREFDLWNVPREELALFYPDFEPLLASCRYPKCSHSHEPGCAVKAAAASGMIDSGRYARYVRILETFREPKSWDS